jgi:hypothetical protein
MNSPTPVVLLCLLLCTAGVAAEPASSAPLSIDRMGVGIPAGWGVRGEHYALSSAPEAGPLGVGAAQIRLGAKGVMTLMSPACALPADAPFTASWWMRSEPAGATVAVRVRDNYTDKVVAFDQQSATAEGAWRQVTLSEVIKRTDRQRYFLELTIRGDNCVLFMDGLRLGPGSADGPPTCLPASVTLRPEEPWGLVTGDKPLRFQATVAGATVPGSRLLLHAVHVTGRRADLPAVALDATGLWRDTITVTGEIAQPFGMLRVEATVAGPDNAPLSAMGETLLSRAPEPVPGPSPDSPFGIHVSLREPDLAVVARLGYKWCRIHDASGITKWGLIEPEPGKWIWHDDQVALARGHGLSIVGMLDSAPVWESGNPITDGYWSICHAPQSLDLWRNYVRKVVGHYAGAIDDWEVWNEPWNMNAAGFFAGGSPWLYAALLESAHSEAKAANPQSTVLGVNTWPPLWDQAVLAMGAFPYFDQLSFHRYDGTLHGRPNDAIAQMTRRLAKEQSQYGAPKPLIATEGGPDVMGFHGSFFSFADPAVSGDWSHGANQFARSYLSYIAAGVKRFIAYSAHNEPRRYGEQTCMMVEPGWLPCPMHLSLAALAHFTEGAAFEARLAPAADVSALVFRQRQPRDYAREPATVAVLVSDGEETEGLTVPLPASVRCFDRWGNPAGIPTQAAESPLYLVATGEAQAALLEALRGPKPGEEKDSTGALGNRTLAALTTGAPPLWTLFSSQGAVAVWGSADGPEAVRRGALKSGALNPALPRDAQLTAQDWKQCGPMAIGTMRFAAGDREWSAAAAAVPDGPDSTWRYLSFSLIPAASKDPAQNAEAERSLRAWESVMSTGELAALRDNLNPDAFCMVFESDVLGTAFWQNRDLLVSTLTGAMTWGKATVSDMTDLNIATDGTAAACTGKWRLSAPFYNTAPMTFTATMVKRDSRWLLTSFCGAPETRE